MTKKKKQSGKSTGENGATVKEHRLVSKARDAYDRKPVYSDTVGPSMTKQEFTDECDIKNIVSQFVKTGIITHVNRKEPQYGYCDGSDFSDAMRVVTEAQEMFNALPSHVRNEFQNDPAQFLDFVNSEGNEQKLEELGLIYSDDQQKQPDTVVEPPQKPPETASEAPQDQNALGST